MCLCVTFTVGQTAWVISQTDPRYGNYTEEPAHTLTHTHTDVHGHGNVNMYRDINT